MKILLSTNEYAPGGGHGGTVIACRHAAILARAGVEVIVACPDRSGMPDNQIPKLVTYGGGSSDESLFPVQRPNRAAYSGIKSLLLNLKPDLLYDVHGPLWPVEAAGKCGVPVVSMIGDYNWYCQRTFLVDGWMKRCTGPESVTKCYSCLRNNDSWKRRLLQSACRLPWGRVALGALAGDDRVRSFDLWGALNESHSYLQSLRRNVSCFVVGDQQAEEFFMSQGTPAQKIRRIPQALPDGALRKRTRATGRPVIDRPLRLGFVGRLDPDKGFPILARAFENLPEGAPVELWVVHATAAIEEKVCKQFKESPKLYDWFANGRVKLFRPKSAEELYSLMAHMDVGIIPSIQFEAPCLVMLEMVAQGTPIVRSESKGMVHVIQDGVNGRTFPYGDWQALKGILHEIIEQPALLDEWRKFLPEIGSDDSYGQRLIEVFAEVIGLPSVEVGQ